MKYVKLQPWKRMSEAVQFTRRLLEDAAAQKGTTSAGHRVTSDIP